MALRARCWDFGQHCSGDSHLSHLEVVEALQVGVHVRCGAAAGARDDRPCDPLHAAARNKNEDITGCTAAQNVPTAPKVCPRFSCADTTEVLCLSCTLCWISTPKQAAAALLGKQCFGAHSSARMCRSLPSVSSGAPSAAAAGQVCVHLLCDLSHAGAVHRWGTHSSARMCSLLSAGGGAPSAAAAAGRPTITALSSESLLMVRSAVGAPPLPLAPAIRHIN